MKKVLADISNISNIIKSFDLDIWLTTLATKADLKAKQDKLVKRQAFWSSYFLGNNFFSKYAC